MCILLTYLNKNIHVNLHLTDLLEHNILLDVYFTDQLKQNILVDAQFTDRLERNILVDAHFSGQLEQNILQHKKKKWKKSRVECTFGILKGWWRVLKTGIW